MNKTYLFKAMWRSTAIKFKVSAPSEELATKLAERQVLKMEGGEFCEDLIFLGEAKDQQPRLASDKPSPQYYTIFNHHTSTADPHIIPDPKSSKSEQD